MDNEENTLLLLDTEKAAKLLSLTPNYLAKLRVEGTGPKFKRFGRLVRYERASIEEWVESKYEYSNTSEYYGDFTQD